MCWRAELREVEEDEEWSSGGGEGGGRVRTVMQPATSDRLGSGERERRGVWGCGGGWAGHKKEKKRKEAWKAIQRRGEPADVPPILLTTVKVRNGIFFSFFLIYFCVSLQRKALSNPRDCLCLCPMSTEVRVASTRQSANCLSQSRQRKKRKKHTKKRNTPQVIQPLIGSSGLNWPTYITASPLIKRIAGHEKWHIRRFAAVGVNLNCHFRTLPVTGWEWNEPTSSREHHRWQGENVHY